MRGDSTARAQYIHNLVLDGVLTRNEGREMEGFDPIEGLDEPLVPVNERGIDDPDPSGEDGSGETTPDAPPADAGEDDGGDAAARRLHSLLVGNADRMARRITGGTPPTAAVLSQALAIDEALATHLLAGAAARGWAAGAPAHVVATELLGIALKGDGL